MSDLSFEKGRLVISQKGRDAKRPFLIMDVIDSDYVLIADGDLRKAAHPKRKKIKHLKPKPYLVSIADFCESTIDSDIRKAIETFLPNDVYTNKEGCALVKR